MSTSKEIQRRLYSLQRELVDAELAEQGCCEFIWDGSLVTAEPEERPCGRWGGENYWEASVGTAGHLQFRSTDRGNDNPSWDAYCSVGHGPQISGSGSSPQEAADRIYGQLIDLRSELSDYLTDTLEKATNQ